jgi:hypothetical protein
LFRFRRCPLGVAPAFAHRTHRLAPCIAQALRGIHETAGCFLGSLLGVTVVVLTRTFVVDAIDGRQGTFLYRRGGLGIDSSRRHGRFVGRLVRTGTDAERENGSNGGRKGFHYELLAA